MLHIDVHCPRQNIQLWLIYCLPIRYCGTGTLQDVSDVE